MSAHKRRPFIRLKAEVSTPSGSYIEIEVETSLDDLDATHREIADSIRLLWREEASDAPTD